MKRSILSLIVLIVLGFATQVNAQEKPQTVKLTQTVGEFMEQNITLKPGQYVFEVKNKSVGKPVGLVVAPATEMGKAGTHIQEGYLSKTINKGETAQSGVVTLKPGTYKYFCPLNPTPEYTITVTE